MKPERDKVLSDALSDIAAYAHWRLERAAGIKEARLSIFLGAEPGTIKHWSNIPRPDLARIMAQVSAKWDLDRISGKR